eukprot:Partr_v1_DN27995_c2_g1_i2_m11292 putative Ankyrin Repeat Protein
MLYHSSSLVFVFSIFLVFFLNFAVSEGVTISDDLFITAARENNISFLKSNRLLMSEDITRGLWEYAAEAGKVKILSFIHQSVNPCPSRIFEVALENDSGKVLEWAVGRKITPDVTKCASIAARKGNLEFLQWLKTRHKDEEFAVCVQAAANGHVDILDWALRKGIECQQDVRLEARFNDKERVTEWADKNKISFEVSRRKCDTLAEQGELDILKWIKENGAECPPEAFLQAFRRAQVDVLQWAGEQDYVIPITQEVLYSAPTLKTLQWAYSVGYRLLWKNVVNLVDRSELLEWAFNQLETPRDKKRAAKLILKKLIQKGNQAITDYKSAPSLEILNWAYTDGYRLSSTNIADIFARSPKQLKWAMRQIESEAERKQVAQDVLERTIKDSSYYWNKNIAYPDIKIKMVQLMMAEGAVVTPELIEEADSRSMFQFLKNPVPMPPQSFFQKAKEYVVGE